MKILFVCTGNTCRSPMAQAVCALEGEEAGLNLECESAGLWAREGEPVSEYSASSVRALYGRDFSHASRQVTRELVEKSDLIIGMTRTHEALLKQSFPQAREKIRTLPQEIPDPYGSGQEVYEQTARTIRRGIRALIREGVIHD